MLSLQELPSPLVRVPGLKKAWAALVERSVARIQRHGDASRFFAAVENIKPALHPTQAEELDRPAPLCTVPEATLVHLRSALEVLLPWKKGPFEFRTETKQGFLLDAEWDCDKKWQRVLQLASPFEGRSVLDVGAGNGYYSLRITGRGAAGVVGIEPSVLYTAQFTALRRLYGVSNVCHLALPAEELVGVADAFDTVLSMGVLYHRRSPLDHLKQLHSFIKPGGELILETIVVQGPLGHTLVPEGRYAQMPNVYFLPSVSTLESWLRKVGFADVRAGEPVLTTEEEQRSTPWMRRPSLRDFLDEDTPEKTVEGHPAPRRVVMVAQRPQPRSAS